MNKLILRWLSPLLNERGEVGGTDKGTATQDSGADQNDDTGPSGSGTTTGDTSSAQDKESFIDPSSLPEELKPHWKRMHRAYTKRLEEFKQAKEKALAYDRFYSDENFRLQTLQEAARQLGFSLTKAQAQNLAASSGYEAPAEIVEAVRARLDPSLQWMAKSLADAPYTVYRMATDPEKKQQAEMQLKQREKEYEELASELTERAPGWEEREDEMMELLDFLQGPSMRHKKFGSKLELLYNLVTGNASAILEATKRMGQAAKNRIVSGTTNRQTVPNYDERIRKAKTNQEAWAIAAKMAEEQLEREGFSVR